MKTLAIETETGRLSELLAGKHAKEIIYLTKNGRAKYAVVPLDDADAEVVAIRRNKKLIAYLDKCVESARKGPRKTLEEIEQKLERKGKK
jgi:hypothetical protein